MNKLAFALVLLAPLVARAEDPKLPFNPYEKAQKGDYCVLTGTFKRDGAGEKKLKCANYARVTLLDSDQVYVHERDQAGEIVKSNRTFSTKEPPSIQAYFDLKGTISDVKVEDETKTVGKKEFATKKLAFLWKHGVNRDEVTAWLSPEVKAGGLVAFRLKGKTEGEVVLETLLTLELAGYGTDDKKDVGEPPSDLLDDEMLTDPDEGGPQLLPLNPFAKVKKGDWTAIRFSVDSPAGKQAVVESFEVTKAGAEEVELKATLRRVMAGIPPLTETATFDAQKAPTALDYLSTLLQGKPAADGATANGLKVADEKKTVGGREFSCQKVTFKIEDKGSKVKVKLWVSPEVKGASFVAAEIRVAVQGQEVSIDMETGGFGNGDTAEWGKTADDLLKAEKEKKKKNADDDE